MTDTEQLKHTMKSLNITEIPPVPDGHKSWLECHLAEFHDSFAVGDSEIATYIRYEVNQTENELKQWRFAAVVLGIACVVNIVLSLIGRLSS